MKRLLPFILIILSISAKSQFLNESFESGAIPANWTFEVITFDTGVWSVIDNEPAIGAHTGTYCAKFEGSSGMALVSPEMDITSASNPYISFWYYMNSGEYIKGVHIKTSAAGSWIQIHGEIYETTAEWTQITIQLPDVWSTFYLAIDGCRYTDAGGLFIDDIKVFDNVVGPDATSLVFPADEQVDLNRNGNNLVWNTADGLPTGYKVFLGTDGAGTSTPINIVNETLVTDTIFEFTNLQPNTTYYWQIVPNNSNGDAIDCPIWSFTTGSDGLVNVFPWKEDFDASAELPLDWTNIFGENIKDFTIENWSSWGVASDHSSTDVGNYLMADGSLPNEMAVSLITPIFDISSLTNPRISFWFNSVYTEFGPTELHIDIYNGSTWTIDALIIYPDDDFSYYWKPFVVDLSTYSSSATIVKFRTELDFAANGDVLIDDVQLYDDVLNCVTNIQPINDNLSQASGILSWDAVPDAEGYILCFGTNRFGIAEPGDIEYYTDLGNVTEYNFTDLTEFEDYYWIVYAYNATSFSELCSINHFTVDNSVEVNEVLSNDITIYPIPSNGIFSVTGKNIKSIEIIDLQGKVISRHNNINDKTIIDISNHTKGLYVVSVITDSMIVKKKIIIN